MKWPSLSKSPCKKRVSPDKVRYKFDKELFSEYLEIGDMYIRQKCKTLDSWLDKMIIIFGNAAEPWLRATWFILNSNKTGEPFEVKKLVAVMAAVGSRYERGATSLDDIKTEFRKLLKDKYNEVLPLIEASFYGVEALLNFKRNS